MVKISDKGMFLINKKDIVHEVSHTQDILKSMGINTTVQEAKKGTITYNILQKHNTGTEDNLKIKFDSLTSHDITYVSIIQTARASGMEKFPIPYVLTNCHNSLCAVGGTINEDDHRFALSAAKKYGGVYVPPHMAVIHSYNRECMTSCGGMILGSDSHTRYGALGTMAIGEGGGELVKQLLQTTYDIKKPEVVCVYLTGKPQDGVGPHDVALAIIGEVFETDFVKNKVMEFVGDGIANLPIEYRNAIDVMTTETACLSSIWQTDDEVKNYYDMHGRANKFNVLKPLDVAYYDSIVYVELSKVKPMIALPFHPSNVYTIEDLKANGQSILREVEIKCKEQFSNKNIEIPLLSKLRNKDIFVDQGVIAGCSGGTFDNICAAADIIKGNYIGNGPFTLSIYPGSQPAYKQLVDNGVVSTLMSAGATVHTAFCGPCFGAGDTPANGNLSIRHTTRNFPNREGSKPNEGQIATVALMDSRSIAATAINGGKLTSATETEVTYTIRKYLYDANLYKNSVFDATNKANLDEPLVLGPNIKDWPVMIALPEHLLLNIASFITDPVTTTDELIPSGETSSYRSNPLRLAEFTLSRKDPLYVERAKKIKLYENMRLDGHLPKELEDVYTSIKKIDGFSDIDFLSVGIGSCVYATKPGDGSAREQAAACQKVLGGCANIAKSYATKRYRSNCINWGVLPFVLDETPSFEQDSYIFVPNIRESLKNKKITAYVVGQDNKLTLSLGALTDDETQILLDGCLMNFYKNK